MYILLYGVMDIYICACLGLRVDYVKSVEASLSSRNPSIPAQQQRYVCVCAYSDPESCLAVLPLWLFFVFPL